MDICAGKAKEAAIYWAEDRIEFRKYAPDIRSARRIGKTADRASAEDGNLFLHAFFIARRDKKGI